MSAYERDQQALRDRVAELERQVAKLTAWSRPPSEMCMECGIGFVSPVHARGHTCSTSSPVPGVWKANMLTVTKVDVENGRVELTAERLPCGCKPPHCDGHQFSASPAAAYPPIPDEAPRCPHHWCKWPGCNGEHVTGEGSPIPDEGT